MKTVVLKTQFISKVETPASFMGGTFEAKFLLMKPLLAGERQNTILSVSVDNQDRL